MVLIDKMVGNVEYGVGSGVVWDFEVLVEYWECLLKVEILMCGVCFFDFFEMLFWELGEGYFLLFVYLE